VEILADAASDLSLMILPTNGVYLLGGISVTIEPFIKGSNFFMDHFLSLDPDNDELISFYEMIKCIKDDIKKEKVSNSVPAIKHYEESISFLKEKDPRYLIINILIRTLQIQNKGKNSISLSLFKSKIVKK
jgi:hypothetical protein